MKVQKGLAGAPPILVGLVILAVGVAGGILAMRSSPPTILTSAAPVEWVEVSAEQFTDPRPLDLVVTLGASRELTSPAAGVVTKSDCVPSRSIKAGTVTFAVDGVGMLNLATATPLWRDLPIGTKGADALALNAELSRLGVGSAGDTITSGTLTAFNAIAKAAGKAKVSTIVRGDVLWMPSAEVSPQSCKTAGDEVGAAQGLATLPKPIANAGLVAVPQDLSPGERVFVSGAIKIPVDADGQLDAGGLGVLASMPELRVATGEQTAKLSGNLVLSKPLDVIVVPPAALGDGDGSKSCVLTPDGPRAVAIVGSSLGQTYVTAADPASIRQVSVAVDRDRSCS